MPDSPAARTPYEVLGVSSSAPQDELRRAYRRLLRETHPDTGGTAARFQAVQDAWARIGTQEDRAAYDRGVVPDRYRDHSSDPARPAGTASRPQTASTVRARSYGHPGGAARERYLVLVREWLGRGTEVDDPFDPAIVRSAPREIRFWLAKALAEEETARLVGSLGIAYTIWNDVATGRDGAKIDHVVLGPAGLFAVLSADWGDVVRLRKGDLIGPALDADERPVHWLAKAARSFGRELRVRFRALVVVVPDDALETPAEVIERGRNAGAVIVRRSLLPQLLRTGFGDESIGGFGDSFDVRTRVQNGVRFV